MDTDAGTHQLRERFEPLVETLEQARDDLGLGRLWRLRASLLDRGRSADADAAWERAADHSHAPVTIAGWSESSAGWPRRPTSDRPVDAPSPAARASERSSPNIRASQALVAHPLAGLRAMRGRIADARQLLSESNATWRTSG